MFAENVCRLHSMPLPGIISSQAASLRKPQECGAGGRGGWQRLGVFAQMGPASLPSWLSLRAPGPQSLSTHLSMRAHHPKNLLCLAATEHGVIGWSLC